MTGLHLDTKDFQRQINSILDRARHPRVVLQASARTLRRDLQRHFRERDKTPNQMGGRRTHWWSKVANSTNVAEVTDTQATVSISERGIAQKVFGGTIKPVTKKWLSIPARAEAYGKSPRLFDDLVFVLLGPDKAILVESDRSEIKIGKRGVKVMGSRGGLVMYWLRRKVTQSKDPKALPSRQTMEANILTSARDELRRQLAKVRN